MALVATEEELEDWMLTTTVSDIRKLYKPKRVIPCDFAFVEEILKDSKVRATSAKLGRWFRSSFQHLSISPHI
jgi:hypothetical protein